MGIETTLFKSKEKKSRNDIADTLRAIAEKLEQGRLILTQDQNEAIVEFPDQLVLSLKVEEEQGRRLKKSMEIELEWVLGQEPSSATQIH